MASLLAGATGAGGHGGSVGEIGSVVGTGGPLGVNDLQRQQQQQRGIQTYPDGTVTNIPQSKIAARTKLKRELGSNHPFETQLLCTEVS